MDVVYGTGPLQNLQNASDTSFQVQRTEIETTDFALCCQPLNHLDGQVDPIILDRLVVILKDVLASKREFCGMRY